MQSFLRANLKTRLSLIILLAFAPAFVLYGYNSVQQLHEREANVRESTLRLARVLKVSHTQMRVEAGEFLGAVAHFSELRMAEGGDKCTAFTKDLSESFPGYNTFGLASPQGEVLCSTAPRKLMGNISHMPFFRQAIATHGLGIGPYEIDPVTAKPFAFMGMPVFGSEGRIHSVVFTALDLSRFDKLPLAAQLPPKSVIAVMDQSGLILARYPDAQGWTGRHLPEIPIAQAIRRSSFEEATVDLTGADGLPRLFAYARIHVSDPQRVYLIVTIPSEAVYGEARAAFRTNIMSLLMVSILVIGIAWIGSHRLVVRKMRSLIRTTDRIRKGDLHARSGVRNTYDEVGQLATAIDAMAESIDVRVDALQRHSREMHDLKEMNDALQSCMTQEEILPVVRQYAMRLFPSQPGTLYLLHHSGDYLESKIAWGNPVARKEFLPNDCWAVRRAKTYRVDPDGDQPRCQHVQEPPPDAYVCVPMLVQGELLGILHLESDSSERFADHHGLSEQSMAEAAAEHIALTLANLRLRDRLHSQAMRDGLTGLFNRRYMEETLVREVRNAERRKSGIAVIMIDIDHFKRFNDTFGHAAGDALLREIGRMMQTRMRAGDLACRYGGEEFTVILPGTALDHAAHIAANLREAAEHVSIDVDGTPVGKVTISLGVASFPEHGDTWQYALHAADLALLEAKQTRNRVVVYDPGTQSDRKRWTGT